MKKVNKFLIIFFFILFLVSGFISIGKAIFIKYTGKKIVATVTQIPLTCDKYNYVKVLFDNTEYEVNISSTDCRDGVYKVGQKVELLKNDRYEELIWPESQIEFLPLVIIAVCILVYISYKDNKKK